MSLLSEQIQVLDEADALELRGTVAQVRGLALRVAALPLPVGATVRIKPQSRMQGAAGGRGSESDWIEGEVVGFDDQHTLVMPLGSTSGIASGDRVISAGNSQFVLAGDALLGRVLNGLGQTIDGRGPLLDTIRRPLLGRPIDPLDRPVIDQPLATGIRAIDGLVSLGRGQRVGVFSSPGVGKSMLLGQMARHTAADVSVIALVGERGREVRDFIENTLGPDGLARSVVVCATSDEPALIRVRAAMVACAIAEYFRDTGLDVLLLMDSVTRFCHAQRQIGLAAGEPPATKGYPPSVFALLPTLLERCGRTSQGSITGLFSVLIEGEDLSEPISDACRSVLDGHIQLSRQLAEHGHYPAIDVLGSVSRVMDKVTAPDHQSACRAMLKLVASYHQVEDLLNIGAYASGSSGDFDLAIECKPAIDQFLQQGRTEVEGEADFGKTVDQLLALAKRIDQVRKRQSSARRGQATSGLGQA